MGRGLFHVEVMRLFASIKTRHAVIPRHMHPFRGEMKFIILGATTRKIYLESLLGCYLKPVPTAPRKKGRPKRPAQSAQLVATLRAAASAID